MLGFMATYVSVTEPQCCRVELQPQEMTACRKSSEGPHVSWNLPSPPSRLLYCSCSAC